MGRQGDRFESLFLDEGFEALDRTNLDAAVEALGSVAATGRLVAVITHLRAVAEQIGHVLSVTREPTGTHTVWLSESARDRTSARVTSALQADSSSRQAARRTGTSQGLDEVRELAASQSPAEGSPG
jgi:ABC-type Mn2+/Zn2+ transport system ATPase subunit